MYELKKIGKAFTSKFVWTGPSSYKKRIYRAAVLQRLRNTGLDYEQIYKVCIKGFVYAYVNSYECGNCQSSDFM